MSPLTLPNNKIFKDSVMGTESMCYKSESMRHFHLVFVALPSETDTLQCRSLQETAGFPCIFY